MKWKLLLALVVIVAVLADVESHPKRRRKKQRDDQSEEDDTSSGMQSRKEEEGRERENERERDGQEPEGSSEEEEEEDEEESVTTPATQTLQRVRRADEAGDSAAAAGGRANRKRNRQRNRERANSRGGKGKRKRKRPRKRGQAKKGVNVVKERKSKKSRAGFKEKPDRPRRPRRIKISDDQKQEMLNKCKERKKKRGRGCRGQKDEDKEKKERVFNFRRQARKEERKERKHAALSTEEEREVDREIEDEIQETFKAKKALLKAQGFDENDVEPADDGTWAGDTFLSKEQAQRIVRMQEAQVGSDLVPEAPPPASADLGDESAKTRRKKRYALFMEEHLSNYWDVSKPIKYTFYTSTFTNAQKDIIRAGIQDIQSKTCINFEEVSGLPPSPYIRFVNQEHASYCGLSYIGMQRTVNTIWLNAKDCINQLQGTTSHEVMHSLGIDHQQTRYDQGTYLDLQSWNIDPQNLDFFEAGDVTSYTGYGVPYDYYSVMHYNAYAGASDPSAPSMKAKKEPSNFFTAVLGQRVAMSDADGELLRKVYCTDDCVDLEVYCGWWKEDGLCESSNVSIVKSMIEYCPRSCGFCPLGATERGASHL